MTKEGSETALLPDQLHEATCLVDLGYGDAICADNNYRMQAALRESGHENTGRPDDVHTENNTEAVHCGQSRSYA